MSDPEGRDSLAQYFGSRNERLFHVGRLDKESEGLILLTNDGIWANRIAHPSHGVTKRYIVECDRVIKDEELAQLRKGVKLEDGLARAESIRSSGKNLEISIHDGRKHIIRRMVATQGLKVNRLIRVAIGSIKLGELPAGRFRRLGEDEVVNI
jgi:23S rRNA pseudouridine2605 synthase